MFQSSGPSSFVLLTYCFTEVVSFPRQAYVPSLSAENSLLCTSAKGFESGDGQFNIPMCDIMFNLEDQYLRINPLLVLWMFNN